MPCQAIHQLGLHYPSIGYPAEASHRILASVGAAVE